MLCKTIKLDGEDIKKFWSKVDIKSSDECWNWIGGLVGEYGRIYIDSIQFKSHRISWHIANGDIPSGKLILHKCDNKKCVNPSHLYLGTSSDNMRDRLERSPIPLERYGIARAKFYAGEIWLIRRLHMHIPSKLVAKMFKTSYVTILNIWKADKYLCREGYYV